MQQPYVVATKLLDGMITINRAWCTCEDQVSPVTFHLSKQNIEKGNERHQKMDNIMTKLYIVLNNVRFGGDYYHDLLAPPSRNMIYLTLKRYYTSL